MTYKFQPIVPQNIDRNINAKDYSGLGNKILVSSIFRTLQGEAPFSGWPAVFLRLAGCNFGSKTLPGPCRFCDTSFEFDKGTAWDPQELLEHLERVRRPGDILVITGGEPTLQHNLLQFLELAQESFQIIQIETNGTQAGFFHEFNDLADNGHIDRCGDASTMSSGVYVVCSPKAVYKAGITPKPSEQVLDAVGSLKFLLDADPESAHHTVPTWGLSIREERPIDVYVSPLAVYKKAYAGEVSSIWDTELVDQERTARNYAYAAQYAIDNNLRLSLQTHILTAIP